MVICMVTNMLPTPDDPAFGAFVKTQIDSIAAAGHDVNTLWIDGRASKKNYVRSIRTLNKMLAAKKVDIIHAHYGLSGIAACAQRRCPVVVSFCGGDLLGTPNGEGGITFRSRMTVGLGQVVAHVADAVIVKSDKMLARLSSASARAKTVVIPNGVDFGLFRPMDTLGARQEGGLRPEKRYVLFLGLPDIPRKRIDLARQAVELLRADYPGIELLALDHKAQALVPVYMNASDVAVLTSDWEGSANMVKEAMACNAPVVAVDAGDAWQLIEGADQCYKAQRDARDIADKLRLILENGKRSNGRERIGHLELGAVAKRVIAVYEAVLRGK
jgi:glycosyltransferase involved in cell wall biosynthesis